MSIEVIFRLIGMVIFAIIGVVWGAQLGQIATAGGASSTFSVE